MRLRVLVKPGGREEKVLRNPDGSLTIAVTARPVKGEANTAVISALAQFLGVPKSNIRLLAGQTSRWKVFAVKD